MDPFDGVVDVQRELLVDYNEVIRFFPNSTGTGTAPFNISAGAVRNEGYEMLRCDRSNLSGRPTADRRPLSRCAGSLRLPDRVQEVPLDTATSRRRSNPLRPATQHPRVDRGNAPSAARLRRGNRGVSPNHQHATMRATWATRKHRTNCSQLSALGSDGMSAEPVVTAELVSGTRAARVVVHTCK
jgi:hypothetical protein